jgi:hypothetical protein
MNAIIHHCKGTARMDATKGKRVFLDYISALDAAAYMRAAGYLVGDPHQTECGQGWVIYWKVAK